MVPGTTAAIRPDRPAVIIAESGKALTYRDLEERSSVLAAALIGAGLTSGDVVALLSDNATEVFEVYWATQRAGLYITAVNWHLTPSEAAYIVSDSDAKALIVSGNLAALAQDVRLESPQSEIFVAFGSSVDGFLDYEDFLATADGTSVDGGCGALMLYSSGTTGQPKGIRWPLPDRRFDEPGDVHLALMQSIYRLGGDEIYYSPAPVYHTAPLRWGGIIQALGGTVVMAERFDAESSLRHIEKYAITAAQMVPTMLARILRLTPEIRARYDLHTLRVLVHSAAPCPDDVKRAMIDWLGPIVYEYYSSTEANGSTFISSDEWLSHPGSVGRSALGPVHICADDGTELPSGEIGAIYFERDTLPFVYHKDPEKTAATQHPVHPTWTTVGDIGYVDDDAYLYLTDRKSFMIISGGVNIYPQEIENVLASHCDVDDVAVIGVPDPDMGESVKAVVKLVDGVEGSPELASELIAHVRRCIAGFKVPRSVDFVDDLPRTPTGKLVKGKIIAMYRTSTVTSDG